MLPRRKYVSTLVVGVSIPLLSGCTGGESANEATRTPVPTTSAANYIQVAKTEIGKAADSFASQSEKFDSTDQVSFESEVIMAHLDRAESALDKAGKKANEDQSGEISVLQSTVEWLRFSTITLDHTAEMLSWVNTAQDYSDNDRYTDAVESIEKAQKERKSAAENLVLANDRLQNIDSSKVEEIDEISFIEAKNSFEELQSVLETFDNLLSGLKSMYRGFEDLFPALSAYENGSYTEAERGFSEAHDHFVSAYNEFKGAEDVASTDLRSDMIDLTCLAGALRDGSEHFETAAQAAQNDNTAKANDELESGEEVFQRCEE